MSDSYKIPRETIPYWPYCEKCEVPFVFAPDEPFAWCECGISEWGYPRPAAYVLDPNKIKKEP